MVTDNQYPIIRVSGAIWSSVKGCVTSKSRDTSTFNLREPPYAALLRTDPVSAINSLRRSQGVRKFNAATHVLTHWYVNASQEKEKQSRQLKNFLIELLWRKTCVYLNVLLRRDSSVWALTSMTKINETNDLRTSWCRFSHSLIHSFIHSSNKYLLRTVAVFFNNHKLFYVPPMKNWSVDSFWPTEYRGNSAAWLLRLYVSRLVHWKAKPPCKESDNAVVARLGSSQCSQLSPVPQPFQHRHETWERGKPLGSGYSSPSPALWVAPITPIFPAEVSDIVKQKQAIHVGPSPNMWV